jgi:predicted TIM-barrel fold metal-dependent hydrolase
MKKIDLENHFYDESMIQALTRRDTPPFCTKDRSASQWTDMVTMPQEKVLPLLLDVAEQRNDLMDKQGITTAVLSCSAGPEQLDRESSIEVCKKTNASLFAITKKYPKRYLGSAILPVSDVSEACRELEKCVKEYGFVSWHTHSNYGDSAPDEEMYRPIFQKAADLGIYVYLHPQVPDSKKTGEYGFTVAGPGLGFTLDTITTITRMIVSGLFDEIPDLKIVLGHLGEAIPFLLDRMDNRLTFLPNP